MNDESNPKADDRQIRVWRTGDDSAGMSRARRYHFQLDIQSQTPQRNVNDELSVDVPPSKEHALELIQAWLNRADELEAILLPGSVRRALGNDDARLLLVERTQEVLHLVVYCYGACGYATAVTMPDADVVRLLQRLVGGFSFSGLPKIVRSVWNASAARPLLMRVHVYGWDTGATYTEELKALRALLVRVAHCRAHTSDRTTTTTTHVCRRRRAVSCPPRCPGANEDNDL